MQSNKKICNLRLLVVFFLLKKRFTASQNDCFSLKLSCKQCEGSAKKPSHPAACPAAGQTRLRNRHITASESRSGTSVPGIENSIAAIEKTVQNEDKNPCPFRFFLLILHCRKQRKSTPCTGPPITLRSAAQAPG